MLVDDEFEPILSSAALSKQVTNHRVSTSTFIMSDDSFFSTVMNRSNIFNAMRNLKDYMSKHGGLTPGECVDVLEVMIGESALNTPVRCWLDALDMCRDWEAWQVNYLALGRDDYNLSDVSERHNAAKARAALCTSFFHSSPPRRLAHLLPMPWDVEFFSYWLSPCCAARFPPHSGHFLCPPHWSRAI